MLNEGEVEQHAPQNQPHARSNSTAPSESLSASSPLPGNAQALQAQLLKTAYAACIIKNLADKILFWNSGATTRYGWSKKEAPGQTLSLFLLSDQRYT